ncbi:ATPase AAA [Marinithermofilum abyssi]|uniref:ATPase AAA n=1 Tax=Marinithermofilum abyssi TaxID=1571185 RepID=A0A8J2VDW9_9BACL|nr:sigma-54-dependent transcriptional regulator [Marinithermofilum abyssi]GGE03484.1 ATPase AAA [Marinithermofilum abyssi]
MKKLDHVFQTLQELCRRNPEGVSAGEMGRVLYLERSTVSRYLNELVKAEQAVKVPGRPVRYLPATAENQNDRILIQGGSPVSAHPRRITDHSGLFRRFSNIVGTGESLKPLLEEALAALFYPPHGLPILLSGETGVGKSYLANMLYQTATEEGILKPDAPYVVFNCAEYAQNPELLMGQLFGVQKGAFTGATNHRSGLVDRADGGILFLDEIHRLPPAGQEMLFYLIDRGMYRRLGESSMDRTARVRLIGATTESPKEALLPTLYRRFSVKLSLPPLRQRSQEERASLLDHFFHREGEQMGVPLSITESCRQAFLTYDCPGNIGQLESDIQIACARAFLRHLNQRQDHVLVLPEDLPEPVFRALPETEGNHPDDASSESSSIQAESPHPARQAGKDVPNVYAELTRKKARLAQKGMTPADMQKQLQQVVDDYVEDLLQASRTQVEEMPNKVWLIQPELMSVLQEEAERLNPRLPEPLSIYQLTALALHIQSFLQRPRSMDRREHLPDLKGVQPIYREAAVEISKKLKRALDIDLPEQEIDLTALLLASRSRRPQNRKRVAVLVVTHGPSAARSMAEVTNSLLGTPVIQAIDMPLNQPAAVTYQRVAEMVRKLDEGAGVLLLVDIGSLTTMGEALSRDCGIPIQTLSHVNLPMVIEAGRKSLLPENDLSSVADAARLMASPSETAGTSQGKIPSKQGSKRLIATVCLTGEGAAVTLESWLREHLQQKNPDVLIRSVRIDPQSRSSPLLDHLKKEHHLIAVVGTVEPDLEGVPYLPAWELLQPEGIARLQRLLDLSHPGHNAKETEVLASEELPVTFAEIPTLVEQGLAETVTHLNPRRFCRTMQEHMPPLREALSLDPERELGLWMHLGVMTDRLLQNTLKEHILSSETSADRNHHERHPADHVLHLWQQLLLVLENTFALRFPAGTAQELALLSSEKLEQGCHEPSYSD